jgi:hypothetical protein
MSTDILCMSYYFVLGRSHCILFFEQVFSSVLSIISHWNEAKSLKSLWIVSLRNIIIFLVVQLEKEG